MKLNATKAAALALLKIALIPAGVFAALLVAAGIARAIEAVGVVGFFAGAGAAFVAAGFAFDVARWLRNGGRQ